MSPPLLCANFMRVESHLKGVAAAWQPGRNSAHSRKQGGWSRVTEGEACRRVVERSGRCPPFHCCATTTQKSCGGLLNVGGVTVWICSGDGAAGRSFILPPVVSWKWSKSSQRQVWLHQRWGGGEDEHWTGESSTAGSCRGQLKGSRRAQGQSKLSFGLKRWASLGMHALWPSFNQARVRQKTVRTATFRRGSAFMDLDVSARAAQTSPQV